MTTRAIMSLSLSALMLGGAVVGCTEGNGGLATASSRNADMTAKQAAGQAKRADRALADRNAVAAVGFAEAAVGLAPRAADYRMLLGQAYLQAGRFTSAHQAFAETLQLSPGNGKAALNLALAQIAEGQWADARGTMDANLTTIAPADRGLALALAGDPTSGVEILMTAARTPGATPKTRQNLALSLALAGHWAEARMVVGADLSPADADKRIAEWAAFAKPVHASDQVAALLGVTAVTDAGRPAALALAAPAAPVAVAQVMPEGAAASAAAAPVVPVEVAANEPAPAASHVTFGPRQEVVQPLPVRTLAAPATPIKVRAVAEGKPTPHGLTEGNWYVQLGAYDSAAVAHDGWTRAQRRFAALRDHTPNGMSFSTRSGNFYRLSVGGFTRGDADAMCRQYRAKGGACFVRADGGDAVAQWVRRNDVQMASR